MDVRELAPGLWRWTAYHEQWKKDVGGVYLEGPDGVVLIDPLVPPDPAEEARFWEALNHDVRRAGGQVHVLITVFWHARSAAAIVERYGARLWAHSRQRRRIGKRACDSTDVFELGDPLPGGVEAFDAYRSAEVLYWLPSHRTLVAGDVMLGSPF